MILPLMVAAGYGVLATLLVNQRTERGRGERRWLLIFLALSFIDHVAAAALSGLPDAIWLCHFITYLWAAKLASLIFLTFCFGEWESDGKWQQTAGVGTALYFLLLIATDWLGRDILPLGPQVEALFAFPRLDLGGIFFLPSWLIIATGLVVLAIYASAKARLPLYANRLLYWAGFLAISFVGQLLFSLRPPIAAALGALLQMLGVGGLTYGIISYRLFNVRSSIRQVAGYALSALLTVLIIAIAILSAQALLEQLPPESAGLGVVVLVIVLAAIHRLARIWFDKFITRFVIHQEYDPAVIVETYARAIGNILDVNTLAAVAIGIISEILELQRGSIILLREEEQTVVFQSAGGMGNVMDTPMSFPKNSPFLEHFLKQRQPLSQYNIDVLPEFRSLNHEQRHWLSRQQMDVYVSIVTEGLPIGLLALGPKGSGEPYQAGELKLIQTLAGQTVVALTNARLFDDMKRLNEEIRYLNLDLRRSNERLQYMDQVKTDFITIASHELRTPLTQIKGYADILDAMNEEGMLTSDETDKILSNITRATSQLEQVISAMLDSSQIDVDVMSLNLSETSLDTVLKQAIHPLAQAMRERRMSLSIKGIRNLPTMVADFQRLVQAFNNLVNNALKYTPDGGRIDITAVVQEETKEIKVVIADTGVGVNPRDQELIFEKFFRAADPQLHSTGSTKFMGAGPGLGLSIVQGIVEAHGGRIWVQSEGHDPVACPGSEFHVALPIRATQPELKEQEPVTVENLTLL